MRLIDGDHLLKRVAGVAKLAKSDHQQALMGRVIYVIEKEPEIDIVHCKDCEEFATELNGNTFCLRYDSYFGLQDPNDFCSHGKRKQEAEHDADKSDP